MLRVERSHASRSCRGHCLPVDVILNVTAREDAADARLRAVVRDDVAIRGETPWPISVRSDGRPSRRAEAPVAMMRVFVVYSAFAVLTIMGCAHTSTRLT